jgi:hypothetical protein
MTVEPYAITDLAARYAILPLGSLLVTAVAVAGIALRKRHGGVAFSAALAVAFTLLFDALGAGYGAFSLVVPASILVLGVRFWPDGRAGLAKRLAFTFASAAIVLVATFYGLAKEECIHRMNGACDEPFFFWGTAVCCSFPIGVLVAGLLTKIESKGIHAAHGT